MEFRRYQSNDENHITKLFRETFKKDMTEEYWRWRYQDNPDINENLINLAWDGGILAGHYALSSVKLYVNNTQLNAALSMTTMTNPKYQGKGLFTTLADGLLGSSSLDVVFGVPNEHSIRGFINRLGFKLIKDIPMLELDLALIDGFYEGDECKTITHFDNSFDTFFEEICKKYYAITSRNKDRMNWRFVDNPQNEYTISVFAEGNRIRGYIITKKFVQLGELRADIVDIIVSDKIVLGELFDYSLSMLKSEGVSKVNMWFSDGDLYPVVYKTGFRETGQTFHFIIKDNREEKDEMLYNFNNWYITMGDIDLF